jgi:DNA-directed RNA polymerase specialized sigma subunit
MMNAKEFLRQAIWLDKLINSKLEHLEKLEALAQKTTVDLSKEKVTGGNGTTSPMENVVVKIIELKREINEDIDRLIDLKKEIGKVISNIDNPSYQLILEMRYINNRNWDEIADEMGLDKRWLLRLHMRALRKIDETLKLATKRH